MRVGQTPRLDSLRSPRPQAPSAPGIAFDILTGWSVEWTAGL